jgi:histidine triad (HIT) family protein
MMTNVETSKSDDNREACIFCGIVKREIPAYIIDENDEVIVFLSLENHPLVVPKKHIPDIYSMVR